MNMFTYYICAQKYVLCCKLLKCAMFVYYVPQTTLSHAPLGSL